MDVPEGVLIRLGAVHQLDGYARQLVAGIHLGGHHGSDVARAQEPLLGVLDLLVPILVEGQGVRRQGCENVLQQVGVGTQVRDAG